MFGAFLARDGGPVGLIAVCLMLGNYALLGVRPSVPLLVLGFCGTLVIYQLDRVLAFSPEDRVNRPGRHRWMREHATYVWTSVAVGTVVGGAMLPLLRPMARWMVTGLGVLGLLHVLPVLGRGRRLKAFGLVKPLAISGAWALGSVLLPVLEAGIALATGVIALVGYRFALVLVNTLVADLGDRRGDARAGLRTIATEWSGRRVVQAAQILLGVVGIGGIVAVAGFGATGLLLVDLIGVLLMGTVVERVKVDRRRAQQFIVDAVVAWPLVTALVAWIVG